MAPRVVSVVLALIALGIAGCTSAPPPPAETAAPEEPREAALLSPEELANATSQEDTEASGQGEFARALEERFHTHNYWNGLMEKTLMDADVQSTPMTPFDANDPLGSAQRFALRQPFQGNGRSFGNGFTPFEMPEGSIVPPETERLEVSVSWIPTNTITGLGLAYQHALSKDLEFLDPFPQGGGTVTIPVNVTIADQPHSAISKWRFYLYADDGENPFFGIFNGTAHVIIKAFRNDTLFLAPPHPDYWGANTTLPLLQTNGTMSCARVVFPIFIGVGDGAAGCDSGFAFLELPNGTIVPPHTALLTLELTWANDAAVPDPFTTRPELVFTPANTRGFRAPDTQAAEAGRAVYTIAVDPKMVDSPYAEVSEWAFLLYLRSEAPTDSGFFGGIGEFDGAYTLSIVAERETLPA